jgi:hypothetical protein
MQVKMKTVIERTFVSPAAMALFIKRNSKSIDLAHTTFRSVTWKSKAKPKVG